MYTLRTQPYSLNVRTVSSSTLSSWRVSVVYLQKNISQIHLIRLRSIEIEIEIEMVLPIDRNTIFNESSRRKKLCLDSELDLRYSLPAV